MMEYVVQYWITANYNNKPEYTLKSVDSRFNCEKSNLIHNLQSFEDCYCKCENKIGE